MNFWQEKPEFWKGRIAGNKTYDLQKKELAGDIEAIQKTYHIQNVLDVGGYRGELGLYLPKGLKYRSLDITDGFDVTKPWTPQGVEQKPFTLAVTSLVMIVLSPADVVATINEMQKSADYLLFYEEAYGSHYTGEKITDDYGGKWNHDLRAFIDPEKAVTTMPSEINKNWERIFVGGII